MKPIGTERQREQVRMSRPSELRRRGGHGEPQPEDGTRRPTNRTNTIITRAAIVFFHCFFTRQQYNILLPSLISVVLAMLYPLHEEYLPANKQKKTIFRHGRRSCAATWQITREGVAIIYVRNMVLGSIAFYHCMRSRHHSDRSPDSRRVRLCSQSPDVRTWRQPNRCSL